MKLNWNFLGVKVSEKRKTLHGGSAYGYFLELHNVGHEFHEY